MTAYERAHQNTADLHYAGPDKNGVHIIIDAAEIAPDRFEVAALRTGGGELAMIDAYSLDEARSAYNQLYDRYVAPATKPETKPLTGKYAQLRDDLRAVYKIGQEAAAQVEDTGTCNMDAPALRLTRWNAAKVEQACKEAGGGCFKWSCFNRFVICFPIPGQACKVETAAEAMTKALREMGYDALTYCQMD